MPPDEFIPLAEQSGQVRALSRWVLNRALRQCLEWDQRGLHLGVPQAIRQGSIQRREVFGGRCLTLGDRLRTFAAARRVYDPNGRLLNAYFRDMLSEASPAGAT